MSGRTPEDAIDAAMAACPRETFLTADQRDHALVDAALPLMRGQTCSQPTTVRAMLTLLDLRQGQRVLDVGSGSAWSTALLAYLVGPEGEVLGLELEPDLVDFGAANLRATGVRNAQVRQAGAGRLGAPEEAPWDRILVNAMAEALPPELVDQLGPGGVMVIPVRGEMLRVTDVVERHGSYRFVPLR